MKSPFLAILAVCSALLVPWLRAADEPVDFARARQYFERRQRGETLTPDEEAYIRRAMAERQRQLKAGGAVPGAGAGEIDMAKARAILQRQQAGELSLIHI